MDNSSMSEYERQRDANIRNNHAVLASLGLTNYNLTSPPPKPNPNPNPKPRRRSQPSQPLRQQQSRASKRALPADAYTATTLDLRTLARHSQPEPEAEKSKEEEGSEWEEDEEPEPQPKVKRQRLAEKDFPYPIATDYVKVPPQTNLGPKLTPLQCRQLHALVLKHLMHNGGICNGAGPRTASNIGKTIWRICRLARLGEFPDIDMDEAINHHGSRFDLLGFTPIWTALEGHGKPLPTLNIGEDFFVMNKHLCSNGWMENGVRVEQHHKFASGLRYLYFFLEQFNAPLRDKHNGAGFANLMEDPAFLDALANAQL